MATTASIPSILIMRQNKKLKATLSYLINHQVAVIVGVTLIAYTLSLLRYIQIYDVRAYNSDLLYLPTLFKDLTEWGGHLFEWRLTPSPYFFPDMLIYFAFATVLPNWHIALTLSVLIQIVLFTAGWALLGRQFFIKKTERLTYTAFVFAIVSLLFVMPDAIQIIQPQHHISTHFGVMLLLPYLLALSLQLLNNRFNFRQTRFAWTALIVLLGLLALSDAIVYIQIILPLLLTIFLMGLINKIKWRAVGAITSSIGLMILLVYLLRTWLIRYPPTPVVKHGVETINSAFTAFSTAIVQNWQGDKQIVLTVLLIALGIHSALILLSIHLAAKQQKFNPVWSFLSLFFVISILLSVTAVIGTSLFQNQANFRYLYPLTVLPIYALMPIAFYALHYLKIDRFIPLLLALIIISTQAKALTEINALNTYQEYYPPLAVCIDNEAAKRGLHSGAGTYWDAKYISMLSKSDVKIVQLSSELWPYVWINNPEWYGRFPPQFVLFNPGDPRSIDMARLINLYGYPQEIVDCNTRELWVYNRPEDMRFQNVLADNALSINWCPSDVAIEIPAYVWYVPKDAAIPIGTALIADNKQGIVAEGALLQQSIGEYSSLLPKGQYALGVQYEYEGEIVNEQVVADLLVGFSTVGNADEGIDWHEYQLSAINRTSPITFDLDGKQILWIRLHFRGDGKFTLHKFEMQKQSVSSWPQLCR